MLNEREKGVFAYGVLAGSASCAKHLASMVGLSGLRAIVVELFRVELNNKINEIIPKEIVSEIEDDENATELLDEWTKRQTEKD